MTALLLAAVPAAVAALALAVARTLDLRERLLLGAAAALFALTALTAPQPPLHDSWTHYLHLRAALGDPARLLDLWDRPGFTLVYAAPAALGLTAARLASAPVAALAVAATVRAARALGLRRPWCAAALLVAQPDFFGQASSTMTELPAAAALAVALWGWAERRPWLSAAGLGWLAVTRPEGPLFAALGAAALLVRHRRLGPPAAALAPLAAYLAAGAVAFGDALWFIQANPYRGAVAPRLDLARIPGSFFFEALRRGQPVALLALEAAGAALAVARASGLRALLGPVATSFLLLTFLDIGHSPTWLDSRYLVVVAPALALLAAAGLDAALASFPRLAPPALLALAAAGAGGQLFWHWREAGADPWLGTAATAVPFALAALLWRRGARPRIAVATLLLLPMAASPPGAQAHHRPESASRRAAEPAAVQAGPAGSSPGLSAGAIPDYPRSVPRDAVPARAAQEVAHDRPHAGALDRR